MTHAILWFEIPADDLDRASEFYSTVTGRELTPSPDTDEPYLMFETDEGAVGGGLFEAGDHTFEGGDSLTLSTGEGGSTVYLSVDDVAAALDRVEPAGGTVLVDTETIEGGMQYGIVRDTEGNRVGLMSGD